MEDYIQQLSSNDQTIAQLIAQTIDSELPEAESKIWHAHPVWFMNGNPIVGFSKQKKGIRLMFWSGADFMEGDSIVKGGKFKDASLFYNQVTDIDTNDLIRWLNKARTIQWDYKNLVKRKGILERLEL
ncbi:MAG: DUF1801 domain-containing protein [Chitinophagales bacterium]|jgi:hypothetical protein